MPKRGLRVGVAFGGRSVEHDVSIITGLQAVEVLSERHAPLPIYIARSGCWYAGQELRDIAAYRSGELPSAPEVSFDLHRGQLLPAASGSSLLRGMRKPAPIELDLVVIATHGTQGEDGCLQGALELAGLPYVGPPVGAAAAAMDKIASKAVLGAAGLPVVDHLALRREAFERDQEAITEAIVDRFPLPVYVKPASLGSSVGVSRCERREQLQDALLLCFELDRACIVEPAVEGGVEVNCAVLGRPGAEPRISVCERPVAEQSFLSFEDKYMGGDAAQGKQSTSREIANGASTATAGAKASDATTAGVKASDAAKGRGMQSARRLIPAPIGPEHTARVQQLARQAFEAFGCAGVSRIDFLIDGDGEVYVNECNTIPGSFSFYLWEPAGLRFVELMDELIDIAFAEHAEKARTTTVFATNLLAQRAAGAKA
jgi:D-alanine-D-alanine ligase